MNASLPRYLTLGLAIVVSHASRSALAEQAGPGPTISLRAYNKASIPNKTLIRTQKNVTAILARVGVSVIWVEPSSPWEETAFDSTLCIVILGQSAGQRIEHSKTAMGSTPIGDTPGHVAYIFYDRIQDVTRSFTTSATEMPDNAETLAHAIVHEIGHLMLPFDAHSPAGIMRASWDLDDFKRMTTGHLCFTVQQAELIRTEVLRRAHTRILVSVFTEAVRSASIR